MIDRFYAAFEARHRGSRELILNRLKAYQPFFDPMKILFPGAPTTDLGCGRGEWLQLMHQQGFSPFGIDLDEGMLSYCQTLDLPVGRGDALAHLASLADNSQAIVSAFHLVEHISFESLKTLVTESLRVLKPGGLLILETPNPENIVVGTNNFYLDPTHQRPIPHQLLSFLPEHAGFKRTKVVRLQEPANLTSKDNLSLLDVLTGVSPDYAIVAQKEASTSQMALFDKAFSTSFGLSLETLVSNYDARHERDSDPGLVQELGNQLLRTQTEVQNLAVQLQNLAASLADVGQHLATMDRRIDKIDNSFDRKSLSLAASLADVGQHLATMERRIDKIDNSFDQMSQRSNQIGEQTITLETRVSNMDAGLVDAGHRLARVESRQWRKLLKLKVALPLISVAAPIASSVLKPFPFVRRHAGLWLNHNFPRLNAHLIQKSAESTSASASEHHRSSTEGLKESHTVFGDFKLPRDTQGALTRSDPATLLVDPSLASLPRPHNIEEQLLLSTKETANEAFESVTTLGQMKRSAASVCFVVTLETEDTELLTQTMQSVLRQTDPAWEVVLCGGEDKQPLIGKWLDLDWRIRRLTDVGHPNEVSNLISASGMASTVFAGLLAQGDVVDDDLVKCINQQLAAEPLLDVVYTDEACLTKLGAQISTFFKPDWSPEHQHAVNLVGRFLAVRKSLLLNFRSTPTRSKEADEYALSLHVTSLARKIGHIEDVMYVREREQTIAPGGFFSPEALEPARKVLQQHLTCQAPQVQVTSDEALGSLRVNWPIPENTEVTLLILTAMQERNVPGRGQMVLATNFVRSIIAKSTFRGYKIIVVDDGYVPDDLRALLAAHGHTSETFHKEGDFSFAQKSNFATSLVKEGVALLLNDDLEVISADWIEALVAHALRPEVGVVGAKLLFPDNTIQHAGISTGLNGSAGHVFMNHPADHVEYAGYGSIDRNCGAVTGAVMAYRKSFFDQMGGFDEFFRVDYNDIDFCLRCVKKGFRVVFTPHANLYHFHNSSFKRNHDNNVEREEFLKRWQHLVDRDPFYGQHLNAICAEQHPERPSENAPLATSAAHAA